MFAEIVLPIPLEKKFLYTVPSSLNNKLSVGKRVDVPFGNRTGRGYVVNIGKSIPDDIPEYKKTSLKKIYNIVDNTPVITDELFRLAHWISETYVCSLGEALNCILPVNVYSKTVDASASKQNEGPGKSDNDKPARPAKPGNPTKYLKKHKSRIFVLTDLPRKTPGSHTPTNNIEENLSPFLSVNGQTLPYTDLTDIYIKLIKKWLNYGDCLFLVPEIFFTPEIVNRLGSSFGKDTIGLWHSKVSYKTRYNNWMSVLNGKIRVMLGTRSAVFTPFNNLKLIIIDNETDQSYKERQKPMYNTITVALMRAKFSNATVILSSRIPSLETYYNLKTKKYSLLKYGHKDN